MNRKTLPTIATMAAALCLCLNTAFAGWHDTATTGRIENVTATPRDEKTATVSFDIRWDKSWRNEQNHDAIWVFFRVRPKGVKLWQPVRLVADRALNPTGYEQGEPGTPLDYEQAQKPPLGTPASRRHGTKRSYMTARRWRTQETAADHAVGGKEHLQDPFDPSRLQGRQGCDGGADSGGRQGIVREDSPAGSRPQ